jgi:hypothetical protein
MKYFLHSTDSFQDEKIAELFLHFGYEGLGLFYTILEKIAFSESPIKTKVLKHQLKVGKKLEKCWKFMESLGLISSNNDETFNLRILSYSEKYQIKKEKNKERILKHRENQKVTENVTHYNAECIPPKVNIKSKVNKRKEIQIQGDGFFEVWDKWIVYKKEEHKETYKTTSTEQAAFDKLYTLSGGDSAMADKIILQSITNQWKGIFPIKNDTNFSSNQQLSKRDREQQIFEQLGSSLIGG